MRPTSLVLAIFAVLSVLQAGQAQPVRDSSEVRVSVEGVSGDRARNVQSRLSIGRIPSGTMVSEAQIRRLHGRAEAEIRTALEPFGLYRPQVQSDLARDASGDWVARYQISPGPPVPLRTVDVQLLGPGADDPTLLQVVTALGIHPEDPFRHRNYERAKATLHNAAIGRGYLDAEYARSQVEVDLTSYEARAVLHLQTGIRYRFGDVSFSAFPVRDEVLHRYRPFQVGAPFLLQDLVLFQRQLTASDYFESVSVEPRRAGASGDLVPIDVGFRPRDRVGYSLGIGYGTDTGLRGTFGGRVRWLNEGGHRLLGELRGSVVKKTASARYLVPLAGGPEDDLSLTVGLQDERFEGNWSTALRISAGLAHRRWGWKETISLDAQEEKFRSGGERGQSTLIHPTLSWSRVRGDDPVYPTQGSRAQFQLRGASEALLSDVSFLQASVRMRIIRSRPYWGRFIGRVNLGATAVPDFPKLPLSFRFFAGGDQSIRGFPLHSVGPRGEDGSPSGGRHFLTATLEWEHRLMGPVGVAFFADAGNVFPGFSSDWSLEQGIGFGGRWLSPFGPLRMDLAWAVTRPGNPFRLHFAFGGEL